MVAYQAESDLGRRVRPHDRRAEQEGRTPIASALASAADIDHTEVDLRITLAPLSSPHRTRALAALCAELDREAVAFPGTRLRMRFGVAAAPRKADKSGGAYGRRSGIERRLGSNLVAPGYRTLSFSRPGSSHETK